MKSEGSPALRLRMRLPPRLEPAPRISNRAVTDRGGRTDDAAARRRDRSVSGISLAPLRICGSSVPWSYYLPRQVGKLLLQTHQTCLEKRPLRLSEPRVDLKADSLLLLLWITSDLRQPDFT